MNLPGGDETILIVDDEEMLLMVAEDMLTTLGYSVLRAANGQQGLELLEKTPGIDLLFSDVVMPGGINGFELARRASELYPGLRILLTSGYAEKSTPERGDSPFADNMLVKPYNLNDLANRVRQALDQDTSAGGSESSGSA